MNNKLEILIAAMLLAGTATTAVQAQRDPAYQNARSEGLIGERADGYLGFVSPPSAAIKALVDDLNIKRKSAYTQQAGANGATVAEMAFTNACNLIKRTSPGEKYQTPVGTWATRTAAEPAIDSRCPQ